VCQAARRSRCQPRVRTPQGRPALPAEESGKMHLSAGAAVGSFFSEPSFIRRKSTFEHHEVAWICRAVLMEKARGKTRPAYQAETLVKGKVKKATDADGLRRKQGCMQKRVPLASSKNLCIDTLSKSSFSHMSHKHAFSVHLSCPSASQGTNSCHALTPLTFRVHGLSNKYTFTRLVKQVYICEA
jgi:hypothetical protein